ncbi:cbb3-type cytochrome c oxidase subunit 3 [Roseomonas sp. GC11]|uniref:cbb3-type cytochrome c oxidase subunit 3 n=1 Tax=Roseomonas sp. GC11 TaxID=2950546 RepID=UPI00210BFAEF|nr:cbb3-type cytochrome c oxidase subunit 3 [Roseomonas sp. GC11]MCQ4158564.1 cbb3-type cytochrome c oxidase subunit 3 [Roseomonas sp. GC11]
MDLVSLYPLLKTLWVVWFFLLFAFILFWVMRPGTRRTYEAVATIPLRDEAPRPRQPHRSV